MAGIRPATTRSARGAKLTIAAKSIPMANTKATAQKAVIARNAIRAISGLMTAAIAKSAAQIEGFGRDSSAFRTEKVRRLPSDSEMPFLLWSAIAFSHSRFRIRNQRDQSYYQSFNFLVTCQSSAVVSLRI